MKQRIKTKLLSVVLVLLTAQVAFAQKYNITYSRQNGQNTIKLMYQAGNTNYSTGKFAYDLRIPESPIQTLPNNFFDELAPTTEHDFNPYTGLGSNIQLSLTKNYNEKNVANRYTLGYSRRSRGMGYKLHLFRYLEPGKVMGYSYIFSESEIYSTVGKQKKLDWFSSTIPNLSLSLGIDVGMGLSVGYMSSSYIQKDIATKVVRDDMGYIVSIEGYFESALLKGKPYCTFMLQMPVAIGYNVGKHLNFNATFTQNYFVLRPLQKVEHIRIPMMLNIYLEDYSQTLFGFGVGYRFDKLPVRKK
jgi:hypothetical protein